MTKKTTIVAGLVLSLALCLPAVTAGKKTPAAKKKATPIVSKTKQPKAKPGSTAKFFVKAGYAMGMSANSQDSSWTEPLYGENIQYSLANKAGKSSNIELGLGTNLSRTLAVGLGAILLSGDLDASLAASVPHPWVFNSPRSADGAYSGTLKSTVVYLNFIYRLAVSKFTVDLFAGPAYFNSSADILNSVAIQDVFPNDSVTLSLATENVKKSGIGFNAGAGANYFFAKSLGVFVQARYLSGSGAFTSSSGTVPEIKLTVGGLDIGAGLIFRF
jgi:opacity protein-like surface antigen